MECSDCHIVFSDGQKNCPKCGKAVEPMSPNPIDNDQTLFAGFTSAVSQRTKVPSPNYLDDQTILVTPLGRRDGLAGRYRTEREIGSGAFGKVYLARDMNVSEREVAIKHITMQSLSSQISSSASLISIQGKFLAEAKALAMFNHINIIHIYDTWQDAEGLFIVMEYADGGNLKEKVEHEGPIKPETLADIGSQLCDALSLVHAQHIIHRDIKPANVLLTKRGMPKLVDFGLVLEKHADQNEERGALMGSLHFMSPEQYKDSTQVDIFSDIYSLGATLYFAATGEPPVTINAEKLPVVLRTPILKALEEHPDRRYSNSKEFGDVLKKIAGSNGRGLSDEGFECYNCGKQVTPLNAVFCASCGKNLLEVRNEKEKLLSSMLESIHQQLNRQEFSNALVELHDAEARCTHLHFAHLKKAVQEKRAEVLKEKQIAEQTLEKMKSRLAEAEEYFKRYQIDDAEKIIREVKSHNEPYYRSLVNKAEVLQSEINNFRKQDEELKSDMSQFSGFLKEIGVKGYFDEAEKRLRELTVRINQKAQPDILKQAEIFLQTIYFERSEAVSKTEKYEKRLKVAQTALREVDLESASAIANELRLIPEFYLKPIIDEAENILNHIQKIYKKRNDLDERIKYARSLMEKQDFNTALTAIERVISESEKDEACKSQHVSALEIREKIITQKQLFDNQRHADKTRESFKQKIETPGMSLRQLKALMKEMTEIIGVNTSDIQQELYKTIRLHIWVRRFAACLTLALLCFLGWGIYRAYCLDFWGKKLVVFTQKAHIRSGPSGTFQVMTILNQGDKCKAKRVRMSPSLHPWILVEVSGGTAGYINAKLVTDEFNKLPLPFCIVTESETPVRKLSDFGSSVFYSLKKGEKVYILNRVVDPSQLLWYEVMTNMGKGYIIGEHVRLFTNETAEEFMRIVR